VNGKRHNKAMNSDLGKASSFSLTQKSRPFTQTGYGGVEAVEKPSNK